MLLRPPNKCVGCEGKSELSWLSVTWVSVAHDRQEPKLRAPLKISGVAWARPLEAHTIGSGCFGHFSRGTRCFDDWWSQLFHQCASFRALGEPNAAFQLPAGCLKSLGAEQHWHFSDIRGISAQRYKSGTGMMGCWTSQPMTLKNAVVCFGQGLQHRCCNLCSGGSSFKCVKTTWLVQLWLQLWKVNELHFENTNCSCLKPLLLKWSPIEPGSTVLPLVFSGEMEVAACSATRTNAQVRGKGIMPCKGPRMSPKSSFQHPLCKANTRPLIPITPQPCTQVKLCFGQQHRSLGSRGKGLGPHAH